jgi:phenylpropionate dioxygenase-like ring-hydroxylating dioxygenase large terminal subunit
MPTTSIRQLLDRYQSGHSLERPFYTDPAIFDLEWEKIWGKYWLFAGTTAQIPKPGDYFTWQLRNDNIVIIRGKEGQVHAHYNSCRHRGSLICLEEKGHAPKLVCPYHQWVFEPDGSLYKARLMPDDFDKAAHGLHPVQVQVVEGFIFISLAQNPPDFAQLREDYARFLRPFQLDRAKVAFQKRYDLRTNWKLVAENFRECYHCGPAHPEYCSAVIGANMKESAEEVLAERQVAWRQKGLAVETVDFQGDSFHFGVRYPLRPGVQSYSRSTASTATSTPGCSASSRCPISGATPSATMSGRCASPPPPPTAPCSTSPGSWTPTPWRAATTRPSASWSSGK